MSKYPMLTHYVSEIDQFLQGFDLNHAERSDSQQKEEAKYRRIYKLRDDSTNADVPTTLWKDF